MDYSIEAEVLQLVHDAYRKAKRKAPSGAREELIVAFEQRHSLRMPEELCQWLRLCNGAPYVGPGGLYGLGGRSGYGEMDQYLRWHPIWRSRGWIPVAGDGCGDNYVLDAGRTLDGSLGQLALPGMEPERPASHPVYFIDHETDEDHPGYVVASGIWPFLRMHLLSEAWLISWPFDREAVLREDPALARYRGSVPLPWDLE